MHAHIAARRLFTAALRPLRQVPRGLLVAALSLGAVGVAQASPELESARQAAPADAWASKVADMPMPNLKARLTASAKAARPAHLDGRGAAAQRPVQGYLARATR